MKTNQELNQLINHKNIINFINAQRLSWLGHVERILPNRSVKSLYSWKPLGARPVGRPKTRWEDDVKADIKKMKVPDWKITFQDRTKWKVLVEKTKTTGVVASKKKIITGSSSSVTLYKRKQISAYNFVQPFGNQGFLFNYSCKLNPLNRSVAANANSSCE
jgi:hypothetical protein